MESTKGVVYIQSIYRVFYNKSLEYQAQANVTAAIATFPVKTI
jgi:hypothetical protein